jgi:signal peptide peptidase SppA
MMFGEQPKYCVENGVAYIPLKGIIGKGLTDLEKATGCVDVDDAMKHMADAALNPDVKSVILDVDSPGGTVTGVPETAAMFRALGKMKPTMAFCDGEACSAGYWVASQANRFTVTPSANIGNVGVFIAVANTTKALADKGITMQVIKSGKFKAMGYPGTDLTAEQVEHLQGIVDSDAKDFRSDVKSVRSFVKDEDLEAQTFSGKHAVEKGLATGIANCYEDAVNRWIS